MTTATGDTPTRPRSRVEVARGIAAGYKDAHLTAAATLQAKARAVGDDMALADFVRENLYLQAEAEDTVAAQFGAVVDMLDLAIEAPRARSLTGFGFAAVADGGVWAEGGDES